MNRYIKTLILLSAVLALSACAPKVHYKPAPNPTLAEIRDTYIQELRDSGVQVIQLGETLRFVVPSDGVFNPGSANLIDNFRPTLKMLAHLMRTYDKVNVKVAAYTDNSETINHQQALTTRQAQVIASYLWAHGVDARLEYAVGYNRKNPVDSNGSDGGRHNNRRVEISFRFYPKQLGYV